MALQYEVVLNEPRLADAISYFEFIGGNSADAVRIAINKAAPKIRTLASSTIREQVRLSASYVRERLTIVKATRGDLRGAIRTPSRGILLSRFSTIPAVANPDIVWDKPPPVPKMGIRIKIKPDQPPKGAPSSSMGTGRPFYMVLKGGNLAIVARKDKAGPKGGKIDVFYGPSLSQVFDDVRNQIKEQAAFEYQAQFIDALRYITNKLVPPESVVE